MQASYIRICRVLSRGFLAWSSGGASPELFTTTCPVPQLLAGSSEGVLCRFFVTSRLVSIVIIYFVHFRRFGGHYKFLESQY